MGNGKLVCVPHKQITCSVNKYTAKSFDGRFIPFESKFKTSIYTNSGGKPPCKLLVLETEDDPESGKPYYKVEASNKGVNERILDITYRPPGNGTSRIKMK